VEKEVRDIQGEIADEPSCAGIQERLQEILRSLRDI